MRSASELSARSTILERGAELRAFDEALARASSGAGRLVVIEGEAGIGKSTLLRAALERGPGAGLRQLHASGSELERQYPYGVAIGLFEALVRDPAFSREDLFGGPAALTASLFEATAETSGGTSGDQFATIHGLYWLALNAAERGPLLLAVDDAQWADTASLRFFHYLARRVGEVPIAMLLAFRTGEVASDEEVVQQLRTDRSAIHLSPAPLSEAAIGELLSASGEDVGDGALRHACWDATRGNPFFVTELIWELRRGGLKRKGHGHRSIGALVPERIVRFIEGRVGRLERAAQRFAEIVAILGDEANLRRTAALSRVSEEQAVEYVRELARAAILDGSGSLAFVHPIVQSAVYRSIPGVLRARLHREAGLLLHEERAPLEVVAAQLLAAEPSGDPEVVAILIDAARQARARGEARVAIAKLRRALEEPPAPDQQSDVLIELARAEAAVGWGSAVERYNEALDLVHDPRRRAELLLDLGHAQVNATDWRGATTSFERGVRELGQEESELRSRLEAGALSAAWVGMDRPDELTRKVDRILASRKLGPHNRQLAAWIAFQRAATVSSTAAEMSELVERAISEAPIEVLVTEGQLIEVTAGVLLETDNLEAEIDLLTRALAAAERAGIFAKVGVYTYCRAWPNYYTGRLTDAIADAQAALRASELGWETFFPATCTVLALAMIERADLAGAEEALTFDQASWANRIDTATLIPMARGRLHLERGELTAALAELRAAGASCAAVGQRCQIPADWRVWTVETLVRLGQRDEARQLADETLEIARTWGARWTLGSALRAAGIAEGGAAGLERLREAITLLDGSPARLEWTRALVDLGAALRRNGSLVEARAVLTEAMDLAHRCGALALLGRSRDELKAAGSRPRRYVVRGVESLTPAEGRVARLAADGRTNREIAQTLFVTPKAVEYHLANAYRKLGIGSRQELASALRKSA